MLSFTQARVFCLSVPLFHKKYYFPCNGDAGSQFNRNEHRVNTKTGVASKHENRKPYYLMGDTKEF